MKKVRLNAGSLVLDFDESTGALVDLVAAETNWKILKREALGLSWRLLVPVGDELRNNPVYGEKQSAPAVEKGEDYIRFTWDGIVSERAGTLDIRLTVTVRAEGRQAVWYTEIENRSPYIVESVYSPYLGDVTRPDGAQWMKGLLYDYETVQEWNMWPVFDQHEGCHSVDYPTQYGKNSPCSSAPGCPFFLIRSEEQGLYAGVKDTRGELIAWNNELRPGYDSAIDSRVPLTDTIADKPVHIRFAPVHMPFIQPGDTFALTPVALEAFTGGWQKGVDIYKAWQQTWTNEAVPPAWARDVHSWLQLHINSPEDELRLRFTELPKVAEECAKYGVKAIQLVGWNDGGQDQGNPSHSFDPRLGTFDELKQAIADCQEMGVKIILFAKFTWADRALEWFRTELIDCAIKDPYGDYYHYMGYEYQTPAQLLDINTKRLIPMCFRSDKYLEVARREFQKLVDLNCDGMLYDECQHHSPALVCFDTTHNHRYGWPVYQDDREFIYMLQKAPGLREDFLIAGEACYDWEMEAYMLAYFRSWSKTHIPLGRYTRPRANFMTAITGFNDRNMINQCLMYRYIISYEPYNFKGWLHDYPDTVAYGSKMDALRREYREFLWDGEFKDTVGADVRQLSGAAHHPYARFEAEDGRSALVIANYEDMEVCVTARLNSGTPSRYRTVDDDAWKPAAGGIVIPARSAVLVL